MNKKLLLSKKFRAAVLAAVSSILTFAVSHGWLDMDVEATMLMVATVTTPFLVYIGAEGYSEAPAKAAAEENKSKQTEELP